MSITDNDVATPVYTPQDHQTWHTLCVRQMELVQDRACQAFWDGWPKLNLDITHLPDPQIVSEHLRGMTGWTLNDAQNEYLGPTEWFDHLRARRFPVTNYIRKPHEIDFTPLPDLFHEYFGHLAFFTDPYFADVAQRYGDVYQYTTTETQQLAIARLWWFSIEFGMIRENGQLRAIGAGLLSSPGELHHAFKPEIPKTPFDINQAANTPSAAYSFHDQYFVIHGMEHLRTIIDDYAAQEGLGPHT
jgi:phenylalanine-4-hydroxylase